jgi:hypothetical protein
MDLMTIEVMRLDKEKETQNVMKQISKGIKNVVGYRDISLTETRCSRDRPVNIVTGLRAVKSRFGIPDEAKNLISFPKVETGSWAHSASQSMGARGSFPGTERRGRDVDRSPPPNTEVSNEWSFTFTPLCACTAYA